MKKLSTNLIDGQMYALLLHDPIVETFRWIAFDFEQEVVPDVRTQLTTQRTFDE